MKKDIAKQFKKRFGWGNGDNKSKALVKNVIYSFGVKGMAMVVSFVNMPIFMRFFADQAVLGLWFTMVSMLGWILTFDLGIGNGLRNHLVISLETDDRDKSKRLISSAYFSIGIVVLVLSVVAFFVVPVVNWNALFNIPEESVRREILVFVVRMLLIGVLLQFWLKLVTSILYAMQKSAVPNFLVLLSNVLLLISTFFLNTGNSEQNLIALSTAYIFTANMPLLVATVVVFLTKMKGLGFRLSCCNRADVRAIFSLGGGFFALQLLSMFLFNTREFFIMRLTGPEQVVPYQIYYKIFQLVSTFFVLAMTPMWSAITQAAAQQDFDWICRTYRKTKELLALFSVGGLFVVFLAPWIAKIWLHENTIEMQWPYSLLFAFYNIEYMWINLHCHFENGLAKLKAQTGGYCIAGILFPVLSILSSLWIKSWVVIMAANVLALLPMCVIQPLYLKKFLQEKKRFNEEKCSEKG